MYRDSRVAVVVPAHNEETRIGRVIDTMPEWVDRIIVVDDRSTDRTAEVAQAYLSRPGARVELIRHPDNRGVGGAIATGYKRALAEGFDIAVVMAGDGQMDPADLPALLDPIVDGQADYSKGNRLLVAGAWRKIPKVRLFGNSALSLATKLVSGYWHIVDSQSGYTAISREALQLLDIDAIYPHYGMPNDLLVRLNVLDMRVINVPVQPVYNVGEVSGIRIRKVIFTIPALLIRLFFWRLGEKYVLRDFHPLVLFYALGLTLFPLGFLLGLALLYYNTPLFGPVVRRLDTGWLVLCALLVISSLQSLFFAMWFDSDYNRRLCIFPSSPRSTRPGRGAPSPGDPVRNTGES